jgi:LPS-assembly protein
MHRIPITRITYAVLCAMPIASFAAEEGIALKPQRSLLSLPAARDEPIPVFVEADRVEGTGEKEVQAEGNVVLRRSGQAVFADRLHYNAEKEEVDASGAVRLEYQRDVLEGDRMKLNLGTERGFIDRPNFTFTPVPRTPTGPIGPGSPALVKALPSEFDRRNKPQEPLESRGDAERLLFQGPDRYRLEKASYTTCGPGNDDWFIKANELDIDRNRDLGIAHGASIVFLDKTIFYTPYISFSLHHQRKSGILTPHYGTASTTGTEITVPYYWNIAPNMDMTFYPRLMTKRGLQLGSEFRYLEPNYNGTARVEVLPNDAQLSRERWGLFTKHAHDFGNGWNGALNFNRVSDNTYFTDLSTLVAVTSRATLPTEGLLAKTGDWGDGNYTFSALAQRWQTLQTDPQAILTPPYNRLPQITLTGYRRDLLKTDLDVLTSYVGFSHESLPSGKRLLAYPSLSLPLQTSWGYFTPKVGMHATRYLIDENILGFEDRTRTLPVVTADTGLIFERNTKITGVPFIQTLEPKLYYVYIPFRDQTRIPNFESGLQDISFASIFTENQFSGHDRINDANQVTFGVTSRLIHPETGAERLRLALAQRYYFSEQRVTLPGVAPRPDHSASSDLLAALSGAISPNWRAEIGYQYNTDQSQTQKANIATRYQPAPGKVLNLAYRHTAGLIGQTDVSFQWPVASNWTFVGRWNYSMRDSRTLEALAGVEYDGGCWAFRAVGHRFATALNAVSTSFFVQLELNGVSRIGSNPLDVLRRNVGGYTRVDPRSPRTDDYYVPDR